MHSHQIKLPRIHVKLTLLALILDSKHSCTLQIQRAKQAARQQALFNCISLGLFCGVLVAISTWRPYFVYLGRIWSFVRVGSQAQAYGELLTEGLAWVLLLTMGWPWNLLIYPGHLTRKELTNARKQGRSACTSPVVKTLSDASSAAAQQY